MKKSKIHRDAFSGEFITEKKASKRPARSVAEPRGTRKRAGVSARFAALRDERTATVILGGLGNETQTIYVPLASLPAKAGVGDDELILCFELPKKRNGS